jgi:hypothetical protein
MRIGRFQSLLLTSDKSKEYTSTCRIIEGRSANWSMPPQSTELLQGTLDLLILKTLALEPMHGWGSFRPGRCRKRIILPKIGSIRVRAVSRRDSECLHRGLKATPYRANRVLALLLKTFSLARNACAQTTQ